ncbi:HEAT repeat domain-containing protein [Gemmata sp.]|uniref:HEAT repeat domain-containing protein n=1 Tax=Gemmata sp. TaxID=1914242 RepID=UPI003F708F47
MNRWFWKRWVWAVVVGTTAAVGLTVAQQGTDAPSGPPKVGDVITLKFRDLPDRQVKVLKSDKQPDGSIMSEVKDTKTGETFTLVDKPDSFSAPEKSGAKASALTPPPSPTAPKATEPTKAPTARPPIGPMKLPDGLPKAKPRTSDPLLPSLKESLPDLPSAKEQEKEKERRFLPSFGKSSDGPKPAEPDEEKPGFLKRVFGKKKPAEPTPTLPPATVINTAKPPFPTPPASPPATTGARPPAPVPTPGVMKAHPTVTLEPPRSQPVQPVQPPVPLTPNPVTVPTAPPASVPLPIPAIPAAPPAPGPAALPAIPSAPSVPSIPVPPPGGLPTIPLPPGGTSMKGPVPKAEVAVAPKTLPAKVAPAAVTEKEPAVVTAQASATPTAVVTASTSVPGPTPAALPPVVAVPVADPGRTALMRDIEPHVAALEKGVAPSQRAMAARALGGCRHGSTDTVKMTIFRAAQNDPNPMVRAVCIEELCKLGYFEPAFELHLTKACEDANDEVRGAAKAAMKQMYPRR